MTTCHHCGQDIPDRAQWHGLTVDALSIVHWRGIKLPLSPMQAQILKLLMVRGAATRLSLEMISATPSGKCIEVQLCRLRKKLKEAGIPARIKNIYGAGYMLEFVA